MLLISSALLIAGCGNTKGSPSMPRTSRQPDADASCQVIYEQIATQAQNLASLQREEAQTWRAYAAKRAKTSKSEATEKHNEAKAKQKERFKAEEKFEESLNPLWAKIPSPKDRHLLTTKQHHFTSLYTRSREHFFRHVSKNGWNKLADQINGMQETETEKKLQFLQDFVEKLEKSAEKLESIAALLEE